MELNFDSKNLIAISIPGENPISLHRRLKMTNTELESLVGTYRATELDSSYSLVFHDGQLLLKHIRNGVIKLSEKSIDRFSSDAWFIPEVQFIRDADGIVSRFEVRLHDERGIRFERQPN